MLKIKFRRFVARFLGPLVEFFYKIKFKFLSFKNPPVIILTPGKVGSSSVYKTIKQKLINPVFHIHRLSDNGIKNSIKEHLDSDRKSTPLHLIISKLLKKKLNNYRGEIYVITITREPIGRAVSSFFQNTEYYSKDIETVGLKINETKAKDLLINKLNHEINGELEDWFNEEIIGNTGINVFENPFNLQQGYSILQNNKYQYLIMRMEDLDEIFPKAIQEFLDLPKPLLLQKANIGDQKHYAHSYKRIKKEVKLSSGKLQEIISSKYFQHFYKEKEEMVKQKWTKQ